MYKAHIPVATNNTVYFKPNTQAEMDEMMHSMKIGDMIYSKWVFDGMWYVMGLNDESDPTSNAYFQILSWTSNYHH